MGMDNIFGNFIQAYSVANSALNHDRQLAESTRRWDAEMELKRQEAQGMQRTRDLTNQKLQNDVDQQEELKDMRTFDSAISSVTDAMRKSDWNPALANTEAEAEAANANDPLNMELDRVANDPKLQRIVSKYPWAQRALSHVDERVGVYNELANTMSDVYNNADKYIQSGELTSSGEAGAGGVQRLAGPTAERMAQLNWRARELAGQPVPKVVPGTVEFVSLPGTDKWIMGFTKIGKDGKPVRVAATKDPTQQVEDPGSDSHELVAKSFPDAMNELLQKSESNMALALVKMRAEAGDNKAQEHLSKMTEKQLDRNQNAAEWDAIESSSSIQRLTKSDASYGKMLSAMISFGKETQSDPAQFKAQFATMASEMAKRDLDEQDAYAASSIYATALKASKGNSMASRLSSAMDAIPDKKRGTKAGQAAMALLEKTIQADETLKVHRETALAKSEKPQKELDVKRITEEDNAITAAILMNTDDGRRAVQNGMGDDKVKQMFGASTGETPSLQIAAARVGNPAALHSAIDLTPKVAAQLKQWSDQGKRGSVAQAIAAVTGRKISQPFQPGAIQSAILGRQ